ncbi:MAG: glycosyltransferase, partial [Deltaproteobacteria bacterium]|nr:glycosyltransferase [Deltaproteobacteria bacterium]
MNKHRRSVAVVIPKYGLVGGAERFVSEMTERLALRENLDIHVFANRWVRRSDQITFHRVPIIWFPKFLTTSSFAFFAGRAIRRNRIDLIHAHDRIYEADLFTMHGAPHAFWVREVRNKSMSLYDRATISVERRLMTSRRCRFFMPVSQLAGQKVLEEYPVDGRKLRIIHPGIDLDRFDGPDRRRRREEVRRRFSIEPDTLTVLFVSMNFEIKGLD